MKPCARLAAMMIFCSFLPAAVLADRGNVAAGDYDGDGRSDIVVARKLGGAWVWFLRYANGSESMIPFGLASSAASDVLVAGDYDGDGDFESGVVRSEGGFLNWYSRHEDGTASQVIWGLAGDTPLTGYFGGAGENDRVVVRKVGAGLVWYIQNQAPEGIAWGLQGDTPFAADVTGDGRDELIVMRAEGGAINWYIRDVSGEYVTGASWGLAGDTALAPADFNGDGHADLLVTRNLNGAKVYFIGYTNLGFGQAISFGLASDTPYAGFFTGSGAAELALYRQTGSLLTHYVRFATIEFVAQVPFGLAGDTVVLPEGRAAAAPPSASAGCNATPGTPASFVDGGGNGALWKPVSEAVANRAPVFLLPARYCGAPVTVLGANGSVVAGFQRTDCGLNGNRAHFWLTRTAGQLAPFAPLTVKIQVGGATECRLVPNPAARYD